MATEKIIILSSMVSTRPWGHPFERFSGSIGQNDQRLFKKDFDAVDVRTSICAAINLKVEEPVFESQTKTKLGSVEMGPKGPTIRTFVINQIKQQLDNYLHRNPDSAGLF